MRFVLRMAWRETRASALRLLFFFLCVALGVAAIVVLRSVMQQVRATLTGEARSFVGADLTVSSSRAWAPEVRRRIDAVLSETGGAVETADVVETQTMVAAGEGQGTGRVRLVELFGLGPGFPFYGQIELADGTVYVPGGLGGGGVLVPPELLADLGLASGDTLRLGGQGFTIRGVVARDRLQRSGGFAFGPRVYVDLADLLQTPLLGFGSRATYRVAARVDEAALERTTQRLRRVLRRDTATVRNWRTLEDRLGRNLTMAENYLSLVGFAIVVLGGIGVWSVTRVVIQQKIRSVAILKCIGATSGRVLATYVLQVLWLAAAGSLLGVLLASLALAAIPGWVLEPFGVEAVSLTASAVMQGVAVGLLVSLLFALVPLLEVRRVKPLLLLRADAAPAARRRDWQSRLAWAVTMTALALVAVWQADSLRAGLFVSGGLGVVALALAGASRLLVRLTRPLTRSPRFAVRHAVISLARPGNQTRVILMAVGLGCFFILAVRAVQFNLLAELTGQIGSSTPDLILIDVQRDQVEGVRAAVAPWVREPARLRPLMRARVVAVEGRQLSLATREEVRQHGRLVREYGVTYREGLEENERVVDGRFWSGEAAAGELPEGVDTDVSIAWNVHEEAGLEVGDRITFDVAGYPLRTRVTSIRRVAWDDTQSGGFFFVLRPNPLVVQAPHTLVGFLQVGDDAEARGALQRDLVRAYPNISIIDLAQVLAAIRDVVDKVSLGITVVGAVTLAGGVLILVGAVAMTKFQRLYEAAIYRTLGAGTRLLTSMVAVEYGLLGALAGVLGATGALALSWVLSRFLFDMDWRPAPLLMGAGVLATAIVVATVGLVASADVLVRKPLGTLRSE